MIERLDGKPLGKYGLRAAQWQFSPSGSWVMCVPSKAERVAVMVQNIGTDVCYLRPVPLTEVGIGTTGNAIKLSAGDKFFINRDFPWLDGFETTEAVAGALLDIVEIWDGSSP